MRLAAQEVSFHPASKIDPAGRVFRRNGNIYRAIEENRANFYKGLVGQPATHRLVEAGLVPAELTKFDIDGYGLVLKHEPITFTSYCVEWIQACLGRCATDL